MLGSEGCAHPVCVEYCRYKSSFVCAAVLVHVPKLTHTSGAEIELYCSSQIVQKYDSCENRMNDAQSTKVDYKTVPFL